MNSHRNRANILKAWPVVLILFGGADEADFAKKRRAMVRDQIAARGITDIRVLKAMETVPRHLFVPEACRDDAYADFPLPLGGGQTISQPYIVALMTESLGLRAGDKVLEVGTGSGYQAAILACLADEIFSIEIDAELARQAAETLQGLHETHIRIRCADGYFGWKEQAPFDAIMVTCASRRVPPPLFEQLKEGGRLIIPLERTPLFQTLTLITKKNGKSRVHQILDVRFVPMTGEVEKAD